MTEKMLTFPSPNLPSPTSPDPWYGVIRSKFNFFPEQHLNTQTNNKDICTGTTCVDPGFFCQGGGGGVQAPQLILQFTEGVQWFHNTYSKGAPTICGGGGGGGGGGGVQLLISIETHITCDFPGGSGSPIPPLNPHMDIV